MKADASTADRTPLALPAGYSVRAYEADDAAALAAVDVRASRLFAEHGYPTLVPDPPTQPETFHAFAEAHSTFVATHPSDGPVGYAVLLPLSPYLHLRELAVDPAHSRRGIGRALLHLAIDCSARGGYAGVSLSTFRRLPFNEAFYAAHGFVECPLEEAPASLIEQFRAEVPPGIAPGSRLLMLHRNSSSSE